MFKRNAAAERTRARAALTRILSRLTLEDRRVVLEDIIYEMVDQAGKKTAARRREGAELLKTLPEAVAKITQNYRDQVQRIQSVKDPAVPVPEVAIWQRIEFYCKAHPVPGGLYDPAVIGRILFPDLEPSKARTMVYLTVKRKSPQSDRVCRDPHFEVSDRGLFRLLEAKNDASSKRAPVATGALAEP